MERNVSVREEEELWRGEYARGEMEMVAAKEAFWVPLALDSTSFGEPDIAHVDFSFFVFLWIGSWTSLTMMTKVGPFFIFMYGFTYLSFLI